tara:strand:- start:288 stop:1013 length:726 start_codon:yes stop_codon:yes gene_type:complete
MKKITIVIIAILFTFTGIAQEKINWLTTSEFEKAIKKEKQNVFIFIEDVRVNENMPKERAEEMQKRMFAFLEDDKVIDHINKNFICYKFNPKTESLNFQGKEYKQIEERGKSTHEFTAFLTESKRNRLPGIVLRDQNFNLFEYQASIAAVEEMQVLLDAERLKVNYIIDKLGVDNKNAKRSERMLEKQSEQLKIAQENKTSKSVFPVRKNAKSFLKTLTYFTSESYQKTDLESFNKEKQYE